jgi:peptidoglycan/xylan/chitin deacetylase (PgdA/CDA1 family)
MKSRSRRALLDLIYYSGLNAILHPIFGGLGAILCLHHVRPGSDAPFQPNFKLEIEPAFLQKLVIELKRAGYEFISLDAAHRSLTGEKDIQPFVCLTFDDGYRDNFEWAYPVLKEHAVPFTIFVVTDFADGTGCLWWRALERVIAISDRLPLPASGELVSCGTIAEKHAVFSWCVEWARLTDPKRIEHYVNVLGQRAGIDLRALTAELCLRWDELAALARDPLVALGGHGLTHVALSQVIREQAQAEMRTCARLIEDRTGVRCRHFAYPFGNRTEAGPREFAIAAELGFKTAVTTRDGAIFAAHRRHLTALPRIVVDGDLQRWHYADLMVSGAVRRLWNGGRCVDAAEGEFRGFGRLKREAKSR